MKVLRWSEKGKKYKRIYNWKSLLSEDLLNSIESISKLYQSEDEFWYCLCNNINPFVDDYLCPVCKSNRLKFRGNSYKTTCENCSANSNPNKIHNFKDTISLRTPEEKNLISEKIKKSQIDKYNCLGFNQWDKVRKTKLEKYGDENYNNRDKCRNTCLQKYGEKSNLVYYSRHQTQSTIEKAKDARKNTCLEKYGVEYISQVKNFQDKSIKLKDEKISIFESDNDCLNQRKVFNLYGQGWLSISDTLEYIYDNNHHKYLTKQSIDKIIEYKNGRLNATVNYRSKLEDEICNFLIENNIPFVTNCTTVLPNDNYRYYELDIYSDEYKIAIEINGTYWHSSKFKDKYYHERKSKKAEQYGIRLIHIYEYEWKNDITRNILKSMLLLAFNRLTTKIYARNCTIKEITNKEAKHFNEMNHLQGHRNAQVTYGLFYNDKLVQLMSFSKTHYNRNLKDGNSWEIIRGCPGSNNIVIGGVSKLLNHFIKEKNPSKIFSYCDFNKFDGKSYVKSGMTFIGYTGPDKKWIINNEVVNRNPKKYKELKESSQSVIWGAGSKKFLKEIM